MVPGTDYSDIYDFIIVTAYNRLPLSHSLWAYAVQSTADETFQH